MKRKESVKIVKEIIKTPDFRVWCEHCSIRIASNEERIAMNSKTYHERCYAKSKAAAGDKK